MISTISRDQETFETFKSYSVDDLRFFVSLLKGDTGFSKLVGLVETKIQLLEVRV